MADEAQPLTASLRSRAARGTVVNAAFSVGLGVLNLLKSFILAAFLSRTAYGVWGIVVVSLSTLLWIKQTGVGDKFVQQDDLDQEQAFQRAFTVELVFTAICSLLILAVIPLLVVVYDLPSLAAPSAVIALVLLVSAFQSPLWVFYRRMQYARQRALQAIDPVVEFVVSIALAAAGAGVWAFVGGLAAGVCAASLAAVLVSPFRLRLRLERTGWRSYWSFSGPLMAAGAATFVMSWSAVIAARAHLGVAAVGVVALASSITGFTDSVDAIVTGTLYPAICRVKDRTALLYESLVKSNRLALMWAVPFGVGLTLFSSDLVRFGIGERWRPAVIVLEVYGLAAAVNHVGFNWTAYFRAIDRTRPIALEAVAATVVFLVSGIPLLFAFGLPGFAAGVAIQGVAAVAMRAYFLQQLFRGFHFISHALRAFLPTVPAAAAVLIVRQAETGHRTLGLAIGELVMYLAVTVLATWYLESPLLREAFGLVLPRRAAAA